MSTQIARNTNIRFILEDAIQIAALTTTPAAYATLPVTNVTSFASEAVLRVPGTGFTFRAVWSTARLFDTLALSGHNLTSAAVVTFRLYESDGGAELASRIFTSITQTLSWVIDLVNPVEAKVFTITIVDDTNTMGFLQIGRVACGKAHVPVTNMGANASLEWKSTGTKERAKSGSMVVFPGYLYREIKLSFDFVSMEERDVLNSFFRQGGASQSIFITCYPNWQYPNFENDYHGFFHISEDSVPMSHTFMDQFALSFSVSDSALIAL